MKALSLVLTLFSLVLSGCAGGKNGMKPTDGVTGKKKVVIDADTKQKVESEYTISGFKSAYDALAEKIGPNNDADLANAIQSAKLSLDKNNLLINIQLHPAVAGIQNLQAKIELITNSSRLSGQIETDNKWQVVATCYTQTCHRAEILISRKQAEGKKAGILVSESRPEVRLIRPSSVTAYNDRGLKALESLSGRSQVEQTAVVIFEGRSYADLRVGDAKNPVFQAHAELLTTENAVTELTGIKLEGSPGARGKLVGNDSSTGDLMIEIISGPEAAILLIEKTLKEIETEEPELASQAQSDRNLSARAVPNRGLFPTSAQNKKGLALAHDFASYGLHPRTQHYVARFREKDAVGVRNVFSYTHNVSPFIKSVFEGLELTPEFAYLLPVESSYLKTGKFNAQQVTGVAPSKENRNPSAYGPWQIVNNTALDIRARSGIDFNIFFIRNKKPHPEDDRGYLVQSTYMAALYLKKLVSLFPQDSGMAIMAYHAGEFGVCKEVAVNCTPQNMRTRLAQLSNRNVTLSQVEKYKMIEPIHRNYAFMFLSWREMGQNSERYGLDRIPKVKSEAFKNRLSRPQGPSPI